ncbi:MAG: 4Fe-4S dicluster domain-containing protein [Prevotella sp.]|nr:4Fe-4S dicluster domain-containing protein [Prevotella sp.]
MLKKIRIILATIVFIMVTLLFLDFTDTLHHWFGWVAKIQFLPALLALNVGIVVALIVITIVFGRIYCSIICPLGIMQDITSAIHGKIKKNRFCYSPEKKWLRYVMLVVFIIAFIAGINIIVSLLAPYSSYGRIASNLLQPIYLGVNNMLAYFAERMDSYAFYSVDIWIKSVSTFVIAAATFVIINILAWRNGRTYCNTICPVGTVLSFFARFSLFKIRFTPDKCVACNRCAKNCKAAAINVKNHSVDYSRCVVCGDCIGKCHEHGLRYSFKIQSPTAIISTNSSHGNKVDNNRRAFLVGAAIATTSAMLAQEEKQVQGGLAVIEDKIAPNRNTKITPPGSLSAQNMAKHCTACQLCVSNCPNGVLRPSTELSKFMQPTLSYERGYCRPECTRCSEVCPTGAIKRISIEDKSSIQIGHAVWIKKNCVPITDEMSCGNCATHCPVNAITMVPINPDDENSLTIPAVNEERCIGCGACENLCPARPFSAIYVEGHEVHKFV